MQRPYEHSSKLCKCLVISGLYGQFLESLPLRAMQSNSDAARKCSVFAFSAAPLKACFQKPLRCGANRAVPARPGLLCSRMSREKARAAWLIPALQSPAAGGQGCARCPAPSKSRRGRNSPLKHTWHFQVNVTKRGKPY